MRMLHWGTPHLRPVIGRSPASRIIIGCWLSLGRDVSLVRCWKLIGWAAQPSFSSFSLTFGVLGAEIHLLKAALNGQA